MPRKKNKNTAEKFSELFDDFSFRSRKGMNNFFDDIAKNFESILGPNKQKNEEEQEKGK